MGAAGSVVSLGDDIYNYFEFLADELCARSPEIEAFLKKVQADPKGNDAFHMFIREDGFIKSNLLFVNILMKFQGISDSDPNFVNEFKSFVAAFLEDDSAYHIQLPPELRMSISDLGLGQTNPPVAEVRRVLLEAHEDVMCCLTNELIPQFVSSGAFQEWNDISTGSIANILSGYPGQLDEHGDCFYAADALEYEIEVVRASWIAQLLAATMNLPKVSICLATASYKIPGFPLIFVNKTFEEMTGYAAAEVLGRNCRFLQRDPHGVVKAEKEVVEELRSCLRHRMPVRTSVTNFRKDGTRFRNFLCFKPIYNRMGGHARFIIAIQHDMTPTRGVLSSDAEDMVKKIMVAIPSTLE